MQIAETPVQEEVSFDEIVKQLNRWSKDLRDSSKMMSRQEVRYLVDLYYQVQKFRMIAANQVRALDSAGEPHRLIDFVFANMEFIEEDIRKALAAFVKEWRVGQWLVSICGIGPVISAGLLANLDVRGKSNCGHFWIYAGLGADQKWNKGEKRPWNASLKTLVAFKAGESFVKVQNRESDFYGKLYRDHKDKLIAINESGGFKSAAAKVLSEKKIGKDTEAYKAYSVGKLPPAHIHARARRYAAKIFLSHVHHVMFEDFYGNPPPPPYIIADPMNGHRHFIAPPNWPWTGGRELSEMFREEEA